MSKIRFEIAGDPNRISLPTFSLATSKIVQLLRELDAAISGNDAGSLDWYVSGLSNSGNLALEIQSRVKQEKNRKAETRDLSRAVANSFVTSFENVQNLGISPPFLSEYGIQKLHSLIRLIHKNGARGFTATEVDRQRSVSVNEDAEKTLIQLISATSEYEGSIEGRLETMPVHKTPRFVLYHSVSSKAVTCEIESSGVLETANAARGKNVVTSGIVSTNVKSEPLRVRVSGIRILGGRRLPLASELTRSDPDFTGSMSTGEYIRSIRVG